MFTRLSKQKHKQNDNSLNQNNNVLEAAIPDYGDVGAVYCALHAFSNIFLVRWRRMKMKEKKTDL